VGTETTIKFIPGGMVPIDPVDFTGAYTGTSLIDGIYQLRIFAPSVQGASGILDGDGDGTPGGDYLSATTGPNRIYRLYGDYNGNSTVDGFDFAVFRQLAADVINSGGIVDGVDFGNFRSRFGAMI